MLQPSLSRARPSNWEILDWTQKTTSNSTLSTQTTSRKPSGVYGYLMWRAGVRSNTLTWWTIFFISAWQEEWYEGGNLFQSMILPVLEEVWGTLGTQSTPLSKTRDWQFLQHTMLVLLFKVRFTLLKKPVLSLSHTPIILSRAVMLKIRASWHYMQPPGQQSHWAACHSTQH